MPTLEDIERENLKLRDTVRNTVQGMEQLTKENQLLVEKVATLENKLATLNKNENNDNDEKEMPTDDEKESHEATKAAMNIAITTLTPPAAKLFKAVYEHAHKIHLVKAKLKADRDSVEAWKALGALLTRPEDVDENGDAWQYTSPSKVNDVPYTNIMCFSRIVELNPQRSEAWLDLGLALQTLDGVGMTTNVNGTSYTKKKCYLKTLELNPACSKAWCSLGTLLVADETAVVDEVPFDKIKCCSKGVDVNLEDKHAWVILGDVCKESSPITIEGHPYTSKDCYLQAIAIDNYYSPAWDGLHRTLADNTVNSNGENYTRKDCLDISIVLSCCKTIEENPGHSNAWGRLVNVLSTCSEAVTNVSPTTLDKCVTNAPPGSYMWKALGTHLGNTVSVAINGNTYTKQACCVKAIEIDPRDADMYYHLGSTMLAGDGKVNINVNYFYSKKECYVKALDVDPLYTTSYYSLGCLLGDDETVTINGTTYTRKECYIKALEINPGHATSYHNLGILLTGDEKVTINGTDYTKKECYIKALEIDPKHFDSWLNLGNILTGDEKVTINGTDYTKKDCFVKAIEINPSNEKVWKRLVNVMTDEEKVTINGTQYTKKECYNKLLKIDPWHSYNKDGEEVSEAGSIRKFFSSVFAKK